MASLFFDEDILMEIFLRLPAKSVGKFRCLSKTWRTNLSTSRFINLHLTTRKGRQANLILEKNGDNLYVITSPIKVNTVSSEIKLPTGIDMVVDSCNGLVLLLDRYEKFLLLNPITLQRVRIPTSSRLRGKPLISYKYGFGYDSCSDDYKIVMYDWCRVSHRAIVEVYSLKSKVWKRVNPSPHHPITRGSYAGVFTNGAIHWVSYSRNHPSLIVAFNLTDEVFYDIPSPVSAHDWKVPFYSVHVLEGCLCIIDNSCSSMKELWIMKEYGVEASWTKFNVGSSKIYKPMCFTRNQEIVLLTDGGDRVIMYNLVEGEEKDIVVDGDTASYFDGITFFDSLVSPNHV